MASRILFLFIQGFLVASIFFATPAIWGRLGRRQGISISLVLFLFYTIQGFYYWIIGDKQGDERFWFFEIVEIPILLFSIYAGIWLVPSWAATFHLGFVHFTYPILIILEGESFLLSVIFLNERMEEILDWIEDKGTISFWMKGTILIGSIGILCISSSWLWRIIVRSPISTLSVAALSSVLTAFVFIVFSSIITRGGLSDKTAISPSLIFLYLVYNIWVLSTDSLKRRRAAERGWSLGILDGISTTSILESYSSEVVFSFLLKLGTSILSSKLSNRKKCKRALASWEKSCAILLYTYSWLNTYSRHPKPIPWRWGNLATLLLFYHRYLLTD